MWSGGALPVPSDIIGAPFLRAGGLFPRPDTSNPIYRPSAGTALFTLFFGGGGDGSDAGTFKGAASAP